MAASSSSALVPTAGDEIDRTVHRSGIVPVLQNIVSTVNLGCRLDLKNIAMSARNAEYNPKRFAAVIMRIREPKTTALIFSSGKMVCTGAKSEEDSKLAARFGTANGNDNRKQIRLRFIMEGGWGCIFGHRVPHAHFSAIRGYVDFFFLGDRKYARVIRKIGFPARFSDFKIQNIVGSCDVKFPIRLEGLVFAHGRFSNYEPELFPGLIYRMYDPKIVLLIFVSGKIVLTGAKVRDQIYQAFENIYPVLLEFKKE